MSKENKKDYAYVNKPKMESLELEFKSTERDILSISIQKKRGINREEMKSQQSMVYKIGRKETGVDASGCPQ